MSNELLPCPFCGGAAMTSDGEQSLNVHCSECDAEGGWFRGDACLERAAQHWNTRAGPAATPATTILDVLKTCRDAIRSVYQEIDNPGMPACLAAAWELADIALTAEGEIREEVRKRFTAYLRDTLNYGVSSNAFQKACLAFDAAIPESPVSRPNQRGES